MPTVLCPTCKNTFSDWQYFELHLQYAKNSACNMAFLGGRIPGSYNLTKRKNRLTPTKRPATDSEHVAASPNAFRHKDKPEDRDFSVFDFDEGDVTPSKCIRVSELPSKQAGLSVTAAIKQQRSTKKSTPMGEQFNQQNNDFTDDSVSADDAPINSTMPSEPKTKAKHPNLKVDTSMLDGFKTYCDQAKKDFRQLPPDVMAATELMQLLNDSGVPISLYKKIFEWHLRWLSATEYVEHDKLLRKLIDRYNLKDLLPFEKKVMLPYSKVPCSIVCHSARAQIVDVLTDPRLRVKDYLFFDDDPLAPPPEEFTTLQDLNSGLSYRETYNQLIKPDPYTKCGRKKVLLPMQSYMDGTVTGQFQNLSLEILKICPGILNSHCREMNHAWRDIGYIPRFLKEKQEAIMMIESSTHVDAWKYIRATEEAIAEPLNSDQNTRNFDPSRYIDDDMEEGDDDVEPEIPELALQDMHTILSTILEGYREIQEAGGFAWDLQLGNKRYEVFFVPFMINIKGDTVEHDKHCGSYGSRSGNVQQLCRYCCCPTKQSDKPYKDYPPKTQDMIEQLVREKDQEKLVSLSQHGIWNAWYEIMFGLHNNHGVHGACPVEILHWINLGMFKYTRLNLFNQTGTTSKLSERLNACAMHIGFLFARQSDRDFPRTSFNKGVTKGKLMAHEMSGMMLVLTATLRSTKGRNMITDTARGKQKDFFVDESFITDWIMLIETQLQFEAWLKLPSMEVAKVERAKTKVKELMSMTKNIGKRTEKMGFNTMNFHATKHVPDDILNFGVPSTVNSSGNERHHKKDKQTAKRTQRRPATFDLQTAKKKIHRQAIELGIQEINYGRPRFAYYDGFNFEEELWRNKKQETTMKLSGAKVSFRKDATTGDWKMKLHSKMSNKAKFQYEQNVITAIHEVCEYVSDYTDEVWVYTELRVRQPGEGSETQIYYATPYMNGLPWNDWAMFDLTGLGQKTYEVDRSYIPCQMQCLLDLSFIPDDNGIDMTAGIYTVVETTEISDDVDDIQRSELFVPYTKVEATAPTIDGSYSDCLLVNTNRIKDPACVIPDLDNTNERAVLRVIPRWEWAIMFDEWLDLPHDRAFDQPQKGYNNNKKDSNSQRMGTRQSKND